MFVLCNQLHIEINNHNIVTRMSVTTDGVWIGNWVY
jgi:hypothetical protein